MKDNLLNGKKWILLLIVLLLLLGFALFKKYYKPHAHTGTTVIETDSAIIEVTVTEARDSAGNVQYETTRLVLPKR